MTGGAEQGQEPSASQETSPSAALAGSLHAKLQQLESSLAQLSGTLQGQVQASQQQTLEHLLLYESAVDELQVSATEAGAAYTSLMGTCRQLSEELRGVDLLAGKVAAIRAAVDALDAHVDVVIAGKGKSH
ncbi:hypothetical protein N2152v2_009133 [Parachlorella kessleri]